MRINFSHATFEEADLRMKNLKAAKGIGYKSLGSDFNLRCTMLDTQGPEIRTGSFQGVKEVELLLGDVVTLVSDEATRTAQTKSRLWISCKPPPPPACSSCLRFCLTLSLS